jgi:hypothetical protein
MEINKLITKIIWEYKGWRITKTILKKNKVEYRNRATYVWSLDLCKKYNSNSAGERMGLCNKYFWNKWILNEKNEFLAVRLPLEKNYTCNPN